MHGLLLSGLQNDLPAFPVYILFFNNCEYIWRLYMKIVCHNILLLKCSKAPSVDLIWPVCIVHYTLKTFTILSHPPMVPSVWFYSSPIPSNETSSAFSQFHLQIPINFTVAYLFTSRFCLSTTPSAFLKTKILKY